MKTYVFEVADTFGGEANYCWRREHKIEAKSLHGALCKLSRIEGLNFRFVGCDRYDARGACICAFLLEDYEDGFSAVPMSASELQRAA